MVLVIIYATVAVLSICILCDWLFSLRIDPREPPQASSRVPFIGHIFGLIRAGNAYYSEISAPQNSEVYTISIFLLKIYIVNSRKLIPLVQRLSKTLSFTPFQKFAAKSYVECTDYTVNLHGNPDFMRDLDRATRAALAPGPHLDYQNLKALNCLNSLLDEVFLEVSSKGSVAVQFYSWSRHVITMAATSGVYGNSNPFLDRDVENAFWTWNDALPTIIAKLSLLVPKAIRARNDLIKAFKELISINREDAGEIYKERLKVFREHHMPEDDIARMQVSFNIALIPNTAPTAFWTLYNIFSRPPLLQELRDELEKFAVQSNVKTSVKEVDIVAIKTKCPLLLSVFQETQRTQTTHATIRKVLEDTLFDTYLLKKGNYLQVPNAPIHHSTDLWGGNANVFDPYRFVRNEDSTSTPPNAFLAWGAAPHLCPARQFASTEILVMVALLVLKVDILPKGLKWERPVPKYGDLVTILPPKNDMEVEIKPRKSWEGKYNLILGESRVKVPLASG